MKSTRKLPPAARRGKKPKDGGNFDLGEPRFLKIGFVDFIWQRQIVVEPNPRICPLKVGTILYTRKGRQVLGAVHEIRHRCAVWKYVVELPTQYRAKVLGAKPGDCVYVRDSALDNSKPGRRKHFYETQLRQKTRPSFVDPGTSKEQSKECGFMRLLRILEQFLFSCKNKAQSNAKKLLPKKRKTRKGKEDEESDTSF